MDYQRLKYFLKAAETLNFSEAARQMYISPQGFGRQITLFEEEIGMQLFDRSHQKKKLTYEGELVYSHLSHMVNTLENEYRMMQSMGQKRLNQVNLGMLSFLSRDKIITPIITDVLATFKSENINFRMFEMADLRDALLRGELDICITAFCDTDYFDKHGLTAEILGTYPSKIMVSLFHDWVVKEQIRLDDLKEYEQVRFHMSDRAMNDIYTTLPSRGTIEVDNYASLLSVLEQGDSFALLCPELEDSYKQYKVKMLEVEGLDASIHLMLAYNPARITPLQENIISHIREMFREI